MHTLHMGVLNVFMCVLCVCVHKTCVLCRRWKCFTQCIFEVVDVCVYVSKSVSVFLCMFSDVQCNEKGKVLM